MSFTFEFEDYFKTTSKSRAVAFGLYMADAYGSNSYCPDHAARITLPVNHDEAVKEDAAPTRHIFPQPPRRGG